MVDSYSFVLVGMTISAGALWAVVFLRFASRPDDRPGLAVAAMLFTMLVGVPLQYTFTLGSAP